MFLKRWIYLQLKIRHRVTPFATSSIILMWVLCLPAQAASHIKSYDKTLAITALALNFPYTVQLLIGKHADFQNRLFYRGDSQAALWNHSLNLIGFAALSSELPAKPLFLAGAILVYLFTTVAANPFF